MSNSFRITLPKAPARNAILVASVKGDGFRGGAHKDRRAPRGGNRNEQLDLLAEYEDALDDNT